MQALRAFGTNRATADGKILSAIKILQDILQSHEKSPVDITNIMKYTTANIMISIMFDKQYAHNDDKLVELVNLITEWYNQLNTSAYLVPPIPLPRWAHQIYFRKEHNSFVRATEKFRSYIFQEIKHHKQTFDPEILRDFIDVYLKKRSIEKLGRSFVDTVMIFFPDGVDTMAIFMRWILLYVTLHPEVQKKIQAEIDQVVGTNRMVTYLGCKLFFAT